SGRGSQEREGNARCDDAPAGHGDATGGGGDIRGRAGAASTIGRAGEAPRKRNPWATRRRGFTRSETAGGAPRAFRETRRGRCPPGLPPWLRRGDPAG